MRENILGLHINTHKVGLEVHTLICYIARLVAIYHLIAGIEYNRVGCLTLDYIIEHRCTCTTALFLLACCVTLRAL